MYQIVTINTFDNKQDCTDYQTGHILQYLNLKMKLKQTNQSSLKERFNEYAKEPELSSFESHMNKIIDSHQFCDPDDSHKLDDFVERFRANSNDPYVNKPNKKRVQSLMMQLIYQQLITQVEKSEDVPPMFRQNMVRWCSLIVRSPRIQEFHTEFSTQLHSTLEKELNSSKKAFYHYLTQNFKQKITPPKNYLAPYLKESLKKQKKIEADSVENNEGYKQINQQESSEEEDKYDNMYLKWCDMRQINKRNRMALADIKKAKFNYKLRQREKRKRWMQMTGVNKYKTFKRRAQPGEHIRDTWIKTKDGWIRGKHGWIQNKDGWESVNSDDDDDDDPKTRKMSPMTRKKNAQKMKENLQKELKKKYAVYYQSELQKQVLVETQNLNTLVQQIDQNNNDLKNQIDETKRELKQLEKEKGPNAPIVPGLKIERLINQMAQQQSFEPLQFQNWHNEVWKSLEEINEEIRAQEKGFIIQYEHLKRQFANKINHIQSQTSLRIQALESALIQEKFKHRRDVERISMELEDFQAKTWNRGIQKREVDQLIQRYDKGAKISNTREAKEILKQFVKALKAKESDLFSLDLKVQEQRQLISAHDTVVRDREHFFIEEKTLRKYYQDMLFMLIRSLRLFDGDSEKRAIFQTIVEQEDDLNYQKKIQILLEKFDVKQELINHVNRHIAQIHGLKNLKKYFRDLHILEQEPNDEEEEKVQVQEQEDKVVKNVTQDQKKKSARKTSKGKSKKASKEKEPEKQEKTQEKKKEKSNSPSPVKGGSKEKKSSVRKRSTKFPDVDLVQHQKSAIQGILEESIKMKFRSKVKQTFDDALKGIVAQPVNPLEVNQGEQSDKDKMQAMKDMSQIMIDLDSDEAVMDDFRLAQARDITLLNMAQRDRLKQQVTLPETKIQKILNKKERDRMMGILAKHSNRNQESHSLGQENTNRRIMSNTDQSLYPDTEQGYTAELKNNTGQSDASQSQESVQELSSHEKQREPVKKSELKQYKSKNKNQKIRKDDAKSSEDTFQRQNADEVSSGKLLGSDDLSKDQGDSLEDTSDQGESVQMSWHGSKLSDSAQPCISKAIFQIKVVPKVGKKKPDGDGPVAQSQHGGVRKVHEELVHLNTSKYKDLLKEFKKEQKAEEEKDDDDKYSMDSKTIEKFSKLFEALLGQKLEFEEYQSLFLSDVEYFFTKLNALILIKYDLKDHKAFMNGKVPKKDAAKTKAERAKQKQLLDNENKRVAFGNLFSPVFDQHGCLAGFEIRYELVAMMFKNHNFSLKVLERSIKTCMFLNKLVSTGQMYDYALQISKNDDKDFEISDFQEIGVQVNENEVVANVVDVGGARIETPLTRMFSVLKDHVSKVVSRLDENQYPKIYEVLDGLTNEQVCNYYLDDVFQNDFTCRDNERVNLTEYLQIILGQAFHCIDQIKDEEKQQLTLYRLLELHHKYQRNEKFGKRNKEVMARAQMVEKAIGTGEHLMSYFTQGDINMVKKSEMQLTLDREMQEEFQTTLELFDVFAGQLKLFETDLSPQEYEYNQEMSKDTKTVPALQSEQVTCKADSQTSRSSISSKITKRQSIGFDHHLDQVTVDDDTHFDSHNQSKIAMVVRQHSAAPKIVNSGKIEKSKQSQQSQSRYKLTEEDEVQLQNTNLQSEYLKQSHRLQQNLRQSIDVIRRKQLSATNHNLQLSQQDQLQSGSVQNAKLMLQKLNSNQIDVQILHKKLLDMPKKSKHGANREENNLQLSSKEVLNMFERASNTNHAIENINEVSGANLQNSNDFISRKPIMNQAANINVQKTNQTADYTKQIRFMSVQKEFNKLLKSKLIQASKTNPTMLNKARQIMNLNEQSHAGFGYSQHFGLVDKNQQNDQETNSNKKNLFLEQARLKMNGLALAQNFGASELQIRHQNDQCDFVGLNKSYQGSLTVTEKKFYEDCSFVENNRSGFEFQKNLSPDLVIKDQNSDAVNHVRKHSPSSKGRSFLFSSGDGIDESSARRQRYKVNKESKDQQQNQFIGNIHSTRMSMDASIISNAKSSVPSSILKSALSRDLVNRKHDAKNFLNSRKDTRKDIFSMDKQLVRLSQSKLSSRKQQLNNLILERQSTMQGQKESRKNVKPIYSTIRHSINHPSSLERNGNYDQILEFWQKPSALPPPTADMTGHMRGTQQVLTPPGRADTVFSVKIADTPPTAYDRSDASDSKHIQKNRRSNISKQNYSNTIESSRINQQMRADLNKQGFADFKQQLHMSTLDARESKIGKMPDIKNGNAGNAAELMQQQAEKDMMKLQEILLKNKEVKNLSLSNRVKNNMLQNQHLYLKHNFNMQSKQRDQEDPESKADERRSPLDMSPKTEYNRSMDPEKEMVRGWSQRINKKEVVIRRK